MIHRGVKWTCEVPMVFWCEPRVTELRLHSPQHTSRCQTAGHQAKHYHAARTALRVSCSALMRLMSALFDSKVTARHRSRTLISSMNSTCNCGVASDQFSESRGGARLSLDHVADIEDAPLVATWKPFPRVTA